MNATRVNLLSKRLCAAKENPAERRGSKHYRDYRSGLTDRQTYA